MSESDQGQQDKLKKVVKTRIKGLGLDALFHQVDVSKKDDDYHKGKKHTSNIEEWKMLANLKKSLAYSGQQHLHHRFKKLLGGSLSSRTPTYVGLSIGSNSIKLLEIQNQKGKNVQKRKFYQMMNHHYFQVQQDQSLQVIQNRKFLENHLILKSIK